MIHAIDFGTTNSLLGAVHRGQPLPLAELDPAASDPTLFRSILYFPPGDAKDPETHGLRYFGTAAIKEFLTREMEGRFLRSFKRFLPHSSFAGTQVNGRLMKLEDIVAMFLREMKSRAAHTFGQDTNAVVLGRPVKFSADPAQDALAQSRLETAAKLAGYTSIQFCPEPVAAAYEFQKTITESKIIVVCDYGGGTSDYTVIELNPDPKVAPNVLSLGGVPMAGDALDGEIMRHKISEHFGSKVAYKVPFGSNTLAMPRALMESLCTPAEVSLLKERSTYEFLKQVASWSLGPDDRRRMDQLFCLIDGQLGFDVFEVIERSKRTLSGADSTRFEYRRPGIQITEPITLQAFDEWTAEKVESILKSLDSTVKDAGLKFHEIDAVYATGGTAHVKSLHRGLVERFGRERMQTHNAFHSVASGLVLKARELAL